MRGGKDRLAASRPPLYHCILPFCRRCNGIPLAGPPQSRERRKTAGLIPRPPCPCSLPLFKVRAVEIQRLTRVVLTVYCVQCTGEERGPRQPAALATEHQSITDGPWPVGFPSLAVEDGTRGHFWPRWGASSITLLSGPAAKVASNPTQPCCWLARPSLDKP